MCQQPIVSIGKDEHGNDIQLMLNDDGSITDLHAERKIEKGTPTHNYYASKFFVMAEVDMYNV